MSQVFDQPIEEVQERVEYLCRENPLGADLLFSAFYGALFSLRRASVCTPFPAALFPSSVPQLAKDAVEKDFEAARQCMSKLPAVVAIASHGELRKCEERVVRLAGWILESSWSSILSKLPQEDMASVLADHPDSWPPARPEQRPSFILGPKPDDIHNTDATQKGRVAFHGSGGENLHSILRCGLLNLSNTHLQRNGSVFGDGIYLSTSLGVAYSFCTPTTKSWPNSQFGNCTSFLYVCELTKESSSSRDLNSHESERQDAPANITEGVETSSGGLPTTYILVKSSHQVAIKYIFVYTHNISSDIPPGNAMTPEGISQTTQRRAPRMSWCTFFIVLYVVMMLAVGMLEKSSWKASRRMFRQWMDVFTL